MWLIFLCRHDQCYLYMMYLIDHSSGHGALVFYFVVKFHENFCISQFYSLKRFVIIFWLLDTWWSCILVQDLALLYSSSKCVPTKK